MDVILYVKEGQVDWVFDHGDIGSGSTSFKGMRELGGRVFVASKTMRGVAVHGEIPIDGVYEASMHPWGWRYRVKAVERRAKKYDTPVVLDDLRDDLDLTRKTGKGWPVIRYPMRLSTGDAEVICRLGRAGTVDTR